MKICAAKTKGAQAGAPHAVADKLEGLRVIDVDFRDTVSAPVGVVERIYEGIGMPMTEAARACLLSIKASILSSTTSFSALRCPTSGFDS